MNISSKCSPQTSYVALSRTRSRAGLRIMRSFPITAFQGTSPIGPALLLATLQHDVATTETLVDAYRSSHSNVKQRRIRNCQLECGKCKKFVLALTYSQRQLDLGADRQCPRCTTNEDERICAGKKGCGKTLPKDAFSQRQLDRGEERICKTCAEKWCMEQKNAMRICAGQGGCGQSLPKDGFSQTQLDKGDERLCKRCVADVKRCGKCARNMPSTCYTRCTSQTPSYMKNLKKRRCDECLAGFDAGLRSQQRKNMQG